MKNLIINLLDELNKQFGDDDTIFYGHETMKYYKIMTRKKKQFLDEGEIYCFIAKRDFINKTLGYVRQGDILKPRTCEEPHKHARGKLSNRNSWKCFGRYGVAHRTTKGELCEPHKGALTV